MLKLYNHKYKRLIFLEDKADADYWDELWSKMDLEFSQRNRFIQKYLSKYINDKEGWILEAGCGMGDKVYFMWVNGYRVLGIDFAINTLIRTKSKYPELNLVSGNINELPCKSEIFKAIFSLGVIEHFVDGFENAIKEMNRVLQRNGFLFLSFPSLSPLRKLKIKLGLYNDSSNLNYNIEKVYQYAYDDEFIEEQLRNHKFILMEKRRYDGVKGLKDEINIVRPILQYIYDSKNGAIRFFKYIANILISHLVGHISIMVFKKT